MNEPDIELLRKFVRQGDQAAFASVVRRHVDLVYGTAVRHGPNVGNAPGAVRVIRECPLRALSIRLVSEIVSWRLGRCRSSRGIRIAEEISGTGVIPNFVICNCTNRG